MKVTYKQGDDEDDEEAVETIKLIDWNEPGRTTTSCWLRSSGSPATTARKRADLVGFVNGIPLVFIELKASHKKLELAYEKNLSDYKDTIPQVFWYNAFVILSNGSKARIGSMTAGFEHFSEWKKIDDENEPGLISLETMIRGTCEKAEAARPSGELHDLNEGERRTNQASRQEPPVPRSEQRNRGCRTHQEPTRESSAYSGTPRVAANPIRWCSFRRRSCGKFPATGRS